VVDSSIYKRYFKIKDKSFQQVKENGKSGAESKARSAAEMNIIVAAQNTGHQHVKPTAAGGPALAYGTLASV
jgi:hypothetical protein